MVSTMIINPQTGDDVEPNQTFQLQAAVQNLQAGSFTNPDSTYYAAPQQLNQQGEVIGHTHFTVQDMGNTLNPTKPLDAQKFAFFKGVNDAGQNGVLSATVTGGLKAGTYRVCTLSSASNHQAVNMPVAQYVLLDAFSIACYPSQAWSSGRLHQVHRRWWRRQPRRKQPGQQPGRK